MKKIKTIAVGLCLAFMCGFCLVGCGEPAQPVVYKIQYSDDKGVHSFEVEDGAVYNLEGIPEKVGYDFKGLYDAEVNGTQYVNSNGVSVSAYKNKENLTLYPQFSPKNFTLELDFCGGEVVGSRSVDVAYDSEIETNLSKNVEKDHYVFVGWFTEKDCEGTQISDKYGILAGKNKLTATNFDIATGIIKLYAGFELEKYELTINHFDETNPNNNPQDVVSVGYGTNIKDIIVPTKMNNKLAYEFASNSSKTVEFTGKIESNMTLYVKSYAPYIEFDANGGEELNPIVKLENTPVVLPRAEKTDYAFVKWVKEDETTAEFTTMPSNSLKLKAVYNAKIIFDERDGSNVTDITDNPDATITLPKTTKEGFVFAGWYTSDNEKFTRQTMPSTSIHLQAKYNKIETKNVVVVQANVHKDFNHRTSITLARELTINLEGVIPANSSNISLKGFMKSSSSDLARFVNFTFYTDSSLSSSNQIGPELKTGPYESKDWTNYKTSTFDINVGPSILNISSIYVGYISSINSGWPDLCISDFYVTVSYTDSSTLY